MIILACDIASKCGLAEGEPGGVPQLSTEIFARPGDEHMDSWGRATKWAARRAIRDPEITAVYLEAPIGMRMKWGKTNHKTNMLLIGLYAAVAGVFRARGIPCHPAPINAVREHFIGSGNMESKKAKAACVMIAKARGWNPKNEDEGDAAAIWSYARGLYLLENRPPSEHQGALL